MPSSRRGKKARGASRRTFGKPSPLLRPPLLEGIFSGNRRGFGFVVSEESEEDVFIPASRTRSALDGDTVRISLLRSGTRPEGEVEEVLSRAHTMAIGTVVRERELGLPSRGELFFLPDNPHLPVFSLPPRGRARPGDKVEVRLPDGRGSVTFLRSFGKALSREANYAAILAEYAVPTDFSGDALREAEAVAAEPLSAEGRRAVRERVLTIDSASAKDLDDAISLRNVGDGYVLSVHIADVSHYVKPHSALDAAAHERGCSLYFADRVVPMLPEALSNGVCSLNEGEEKYTLTAEMTLGADGSLQKTRIYPSVIKSCMRGVYSEVNDLFERGKSSEFYPKYREVYGTLFKMRKLAAVLIGDGVRRGVLELETAEPVISLGEDGNPTDIQREERGEAERLIEAFMLVANRAVAELLHERGIPCVYRVHEPPPPEKYEALTEYLAALSLPAPWRGNEAPTSLALRTLIGRAAERGLGLPVSFAVLRSMAKARYTATPLGHFGLSLPLYCHFTSPIRRLSDLVTHRIIHAVLLGGEASGKYRAAARRAGDAATECEVRALAAERRIEALYKCLYMAKHRGEDFCGLVSSVTQGGYYVELDNTCEGFVPRSLMDGEYSYDERSRTLVGRDRTVSIGDAAHVRVRDADIPTGRVTFEPLEEK